MMLVGLNSTGVSWAKLRSDPTPAPTYLSYRCSRCDVQGYSLEQPHVCWYCETADHLVPR